MNCFHSIVIDKNYTKKGIASLLLNHIFKFCNTNNIKINNIPFPIPITAIMDDMV